MTPKDILTNPNFCPMPWLGVMYNFDGTVKNCIRSSEPLGNIKHHSIDWLLTQGKNLERQQHIVDRESVASCSTCKDLEVGTTGYNIVSDRVFYIRELKSQNPTVYTPGQHQLRAIDIRWSNLCNFACVYCSPEYSSRWAQELGVNLEPPNAQQQQQFSKWILDQAPQLRHVYLAGGEPLLMKQNLELLDRLDPEVNIRINTNLSKVDTKVFEKICEFSNVHWTISVESMHAEFEYIRYGAKWQDFVDNLEHVSGLGHRVTFNMLYFMLNHFSLFDCVDWLMSKGFHANSFVINAFDDPGFFDIRHLPHSVLHLVQQEIDRRIQARPGFLLENSLNNILKHLARPIDQDFETWISQLAMMDQRRGVDSKSIFTQLYSYVDQQ